MGAQRQQVCCSPRGSSQNQCLVLSCKKQRQDRAHKWVDSTDVLTLVLKLLFQTHLTISTELWHIVLFLQRCLTSSRPTASSGAPRDSFWCWLDSGGQLKLCVFVWALQTQEATDDKLNNFSDTSYESWAPDSNSDLRLAVLFLHLFVSFWMNVFLCMDNLLFSCVCSMNGALAFVDTSDCTMMNIAEHYMASDVEWDPTGRYVVTSVSWWSHKVRAAPWRQKHSSFSFSCENNSVVMVWKFTQILFPQPCVFFVCV